ncbi:NAD-specific glutamate dehydrogenase [Pseudomonas sp. IT-P291]
MGWRGEGVFCRVFPVAVLASSRAGSLPQGVAFAHRYQSCQRSTVGASLLAKAAIRSQAQGNKKPRKARTVRGFGCCGEILQAGSRTQSVGAVGFFPGERGEGVVTHGLGCRGATEVAVRSGFLIHRVQQVEHGGDRVWTQVEHFADQFDDLVIADLAGAEGVQRDRSRLGNADGVGHLNFATLGQAGGNNVLGHVTTGVGCRTVNLRWIFTGERATAVTGHAAVAVDDDLATGQAAVTHRAADDELAGRVDVELGVLAQQFGRQHVLDDQLHHAFAQVVVRHFRVVLGRQDNGVDADNLAVFIAAGHLRLGVRTQPRQQAGFAGFGLALYQLVREGDRCWHQHVGFVAGVAEHQALVAGTLIFRPGTVDTLVDVRGLLADDVHHAAGRTVEADVGAVVANAQDHVTNDLFQVDPGRGGDFASDDRHARFHQSLARHTGELVFSNDGVQHRIRNLVGDFVRMPFRHGLGGEKGVFAHLDVFLKLPMVSVASRSLKMADLDLETIT